MVVPPPASAVERTRVVPRATQAAPVLAADLPASGRRGLLIGGVAAAVAVAGGGWWWLRAPAPVPPGAASAAPPSAAATVPAPAAATAPVPAPVSTAGGGFDAASAFDRVVAAGSPNLTPTLTAAQTQWRIDRDKLVFTVTSPADGHVYVFNHGTDGSLLQLYPNAQTPDLRIRAGQPLTLPQRGLQLDVAGPEGTGRLLVLVSRWPRDMTAFAPKLDGGFTSFPTGSVAAALEGANAGRLPLLAGQPVCTAGADCSDAFGAAVMRLEVVR